MSAFGLPTHVPFFGTNSAPTYTFNANRPSAIPFSAPKLIGWLVGIFIVIMTILVFLHYFVTPIFRLNPGGSGIIPVPGMSDGVVYWNKGHIAPFKDSDTILGEQTSNWSFALDMFIEEPMMISSYPRIIFYRGAQANSTPASNTIIGVLHNYNVAIALAPDTTDMIVSVLNTDNNMENVIIPNAPVQTAFRVGVVIMDSLMEVYVNGRLFRTRTFSRPPKAVSGSLVPPQSDMTNLAKVSTLHLWKRAITPAEMRYASPALSTFDAVAAMKGIGSAVMAAAAAGACNTSEVKSIESSIKNL